MLCGIRQQYLNFFTLACIVFCFIPKVCANGKGCESIFSNLAINPQLFLPSADRVEIEMSTNKKTFIASLEDIKHHSVEVGRRENGRQFLVSDFVVISKLNGTDFLDQERDDKFSFLVNLSNLLLEEPRNFFVMADSILMAKTVYDGVAKSLRLIDFYKESELKSSLTATYYEFLKKVYYTVRLKNSFQRPLLIREILDKTSDEFLQEYLAKVRFLVRKTSEDIFSILKQEPRALNIIDLKLAYISTLSRVCGVYIPLMADNIIIDDNEEIKEKKYERIFSYIVDFYTRTNNDYYKIKMFHPNDKINSFIQESIEMYAKDSWKFYKDISFYLDNVQQQIKYIVVSPLESFLPVNLELYASKQILQKEFLEYSGVLIYFRERKNRGFFDGFLDRKEKRVGTGGYVFKVGSELNVDNFALLRGQMSLYPLFSSYGQYVKYSKGFTKEFYRFMQFFYDYQEGS